MATPEAGWYDDPTEPGRLRWWDGSRWTEQTRVTPVVVIPDPPRTEPNRSIPPPPSAPSADQGQPTPPSPWTVSDAASVPSAPDTSWQGAMPPGPTQVAAAKRRRGVALGVALAVAGVGAALGFGLAQEGGNVFELEAGMCFDDDEAMQGEDTYSVGDVPIVDCADPHHNEVFDTFEVDVVAFPGVTGMSDLALESCRDRFTDAVGFPVELTDLDVSALWPTRESWDAGDREVVCFLYAFDRGRVSGSRLGLASASQTVFALDVGDCFDAPVLEPDRPVRSVEVLDCSMPHFGEVYVSVPLDPGPWPGRAGVIEEADGLCLDAFEPYVGQEWENSILYYRALTPTEASWRAGDREVICFLHDLDGDIVGRARDWAAAHPLEDVDTASDFDVSHLELGDCFDDDFEDGAFPVVPCDGPHDNEVFAVFELEPGPWPGTDDVMDRVDAVCTPALADWVGGEPTNLLWFSFHPTSQNWEAGDRHVVCALYDADFAVLERSQRRGPV